MSRALQLHPLPEADRVSLLAVGKAAAGMAEAFVEQSGVRVVRGLVIGTHAAPLPAPLEWHQSAHPVPDARSLDAARRALALCRDQTQRDALIVLISGGTSALMAQPAAGVDFEDKQATTRQLLSAGAEITALNCVRKHLSGIKGGQLAAACGGHLSGWLLSDVVGDDPSVIGSGPTVPDPTTFADALAVLDRYGGRTTYPTGVVGHLEAGRDGRVPETPKPGPTFARVDTRVIGSAAIAVEAAARTARALGFDVVVRPDPIVGEARNAARGHVAWVRDRIGRPGRPVCVISSGETTVAVRGRGVGGRNQEFALAAALEAANDGGMHVASVGTDGVDGPTDAAGAIADQATLERARQRGMSPIAYLDANDSWTFFHRIGGHLRPGPTDTNVGDVQIVLVQ